MNMNQKSEKIKVANTYWLYSRGFHKSVQAFNGDLARSLCQLYNEMNRAVMTAASITWRDVLNSTFLVEYKIESKK